MYTLMMMTAMTTAPDATQFNGFFRELFNRDGSCNGSSCQGNSCQGNSASNTAKTSCQGSCQSSCHGHGLFHGGIIDSFRNRTSNSCQGSSCNGSSCQGSSCQGNSANAIRSSCQGCCGGGGMAYASCMGSSCFGSMPMNIPYAPMGGEFSQPYPISYASPMDFGGGCLGGGMPMGGTYPMIPSPSLPMIPGGPPMTMPAPEQAQPRAVPPTENNTYKLNDTNRATVVVKLPADAKLYAEGRPLNLVGTERKFTTPALPVERDAVYTFRAEYTLDGEQVTRSKKVNVRAGSVAVVEFNDLLTKNSVKVPELFAGSEPKLGAPVMPVSNPVRISVPVPAMKPVEAPVPAPTILPPLGAGTVKALPTDRAKITVKVPEGAVLFVDGRKNERTDAVREFTSPTLVAGKLYTYVMRIERGAEKEERKIEFMAGEAHTVDFTNWPTGDRRAAR